MNLGVQATSQLRTRRSSRFGRDPAAKSVPPASLLIHRDPSPVFFPVNRGPNLANILQTNSLASAECNGHQPIRTFKVSPF
jgi:hypothetical protein